MTHSSSELPDVIRPGDLAQAGLLEMAVQDVMTAKGKRQLVLFRVRDGRLLVEHGDGCQTVTRFSCERVRRWLDAPDEPLVGTSLGTPSAFLLDRTAEPQGQVAIRSLDVPLWLLSSRTLAFLRVKV